MTVTYLYHSGFAVEFEDIMLIFDYYKGELPRTAEGKKLYVFSSHAHKDHFQKCIFDWSREYDVTYILSDDIEEKEPSARVIYMGAGEELQVDELKIKTLHSTDEGVAFFVYVGEIAIYHAGDLNWWHWEEESRQYNEDMKKNYQREIALLEGVHIDLAFLPLDPRQGQAYNWGLDYFVRHTDTKKIFPMHLWGSYKTIQKLLDDPVSEGYRDRIVKIRKRGQRFES